MLLLLSMWSVRKPLVLLLLCLLRWCSLLRLRLRAVNLRSLLLMLLWLLLLFAKQFGGDRDPATTQLLSEPRVIPLLLGGGSGVQRSRIRPCLSRPSPSHPEGVFWQHVHIRVTVVAISCSCWSSCGRRRRALPPIAPAGSVNALPSRVAGECMSCLHSGAGTCGRAGR